MESSNDVTYEEIEYSVLIELGRFMFPNDAVEAVLAKAKELGIQIDKNSLSATVEDKGVSAMAIGKKVYVAGFKEAGDILVPKYDLDKDIKNNIEQLKLFTEISSTRDREKEMYERRQEEFDRMIEEKDDK